MPRISPVNMNGEVSKNIVEMLASVTKELGSLPNIFTTFANSESALSAYLSFSKAVSKGVLSAKQRELIAIAVAQENNCGYCLSAHAAIGESVGLSKEDTKLARSGAAVKSQDDDIVNFALKILDTKGNVDDADLEEIRTACGSDEYVIEIVANVVLNIFTNYINRLSETEIDFPEVDLESVA